MFVNRRSAINDAIKSVIRPKSWAEMSEVPIGSRINGLGAFVTMDTDQMILPVMIPRAATPAVTGWDSSWVIAGGAALALLLSWGLFGSKVMREKKPQRTTRTRSKKLRITKGRSRRKKK